MPERYRKKPIRVEAEQLDGDNVYRLAEWCHGSTDGVTITLNNEQGDMIVEQWDWVIRGVEGEFYRCPPSIFEASYELVTTTT